MWVRQVIKTGKLSLHTQTFVQIKLVYNKQFFVLLAELQTTDTMLLLKTETEPLQLFQTVSPLLWKNQPSWICKDLSWEQTLEMRPSGFRFCPAASGCRKSHSSISTQRNQRELMFGKDSTRSFIPVFSEFPSSILRLSAPLSFPHKHPFPCWSAATSLCVGISVTFMFVTMLISPSFEIKREKTLQLQQTWIFYCNINMFKQRSALVSDLFICCICSAVAYFSDRDQ